MITDTNIAPYKSLFKKQPKTFKAFNIIGVTCILSLSTIGCLGTNSSLSMQGRLNQAQEISQSSHFFTKDIPTSSFVIRSHIKLQNSPHNQINRNTINTSKKTARIYIEGDGLAWVSRQTPSLDPTPTYPLALKLASQDTSPNVIYLARPCQYTKKATAKLCSLKYWTSHRFSPEVLQALNEALNYFQEEYSISHFELIGFSGGGAIAALLSEKRKDVISLRTVAGNINHGLVMRMHNVSPLTGSLDAIHIAPKIAHIPQHHFIGGKDKIITSDISESFKKESNDSSCIKTSVISSASHEKGWSDIWPALLQYSLGCSK